MPKLRPLLVIARYELWDALRSRLVALVLLVYGMGSVVGSWLFMQALTGAERAARSALTEELGLPGGMLPEDMVRRKALPGMIQSFVSDPALRDRLLELDPLAIFYAFTALNVVSGIVLVTSAGAHAADLQSGATRFVLTRCDRSTWALGKALGHAVLLALGVATGALAAAAVSVYVSGTLDLGALFELCAASSWAWVYGLSYLGIFSAVSLVSSAPLRARVLGLFVLFMLWLGHLAAAAESLAPAAPGRWLWVWVFPAHYQSYLWSPAGVVFTLAALALLGIGALWFTAGYLAFRRRDV